jgi:hypothetical protein
MRNSIVFYRLRTIVRVIESRRLKRKELEKVVLLSKFQQVNLQLEDL